MKTNISKKAHYLEHIEKQKESGVSMSKYCRLNGNSGLISVVVDLGVSK